MFSSKPSDVVTRFTLTEKSAIFFPVTFSAVVFPSNTFCHSSLYFFFFFFFVTRSTCPAISSTHHSNTNSLKNSIYLKAYIDDDFTKTGVDSSQNISRELGGQTPSRQMVGLCNSNSSWFSFCHFLFHEHSLKLDTLSEDCKTVNKVKLFSISSVGEDKLE